jgi:type I restriction enzyme S subunit
MQEEKQLVPQLRFSEFEGEWIMKKFRKIVDINPKNKELPNSFIYIDLESVNNGNLLKEERIFKVDAPSRAQRLLSKKDILYQTVRPYQKNNYFFDKAENDYVASTGYAQIRTSNNSTSFLYQYIHTNYFVNKVLLRCTGTSYPAINSTDLSKIKVATPLLSEQQKIANFLTAIDKRIHTLEKKKTLLEQYKKGVMHKIFKQELRFKDDDGNDFLEWEKAHLGSFIKEYKSKSKVRNEFLVFTSSNKGLMLQSDYYGENRLTDRDNTGFNIIPKGYITFRSRSDNRKFTFNLNDLELTGLISVYYPVFKSIGGSSKFIIELLNFSQNYIGKFSVGTSQTVLSFAQLSKIKFEFPSPEEQLKIANSLSAIDKNIALVTKKIEHTKTYKKGLLQQMFV